MWESPRDGDLSEKMAAVGEVPEDERLGRLARQAGVFVPKGSGEVAAGIQHRPSPDPKPEGDHGVGSAVGGY